MMSYGLAEAVVVAGNWPPLENLGIAAPAIDEPARVARLVLDLTSRRQRGGWAMQLDAAVAATPARLVVVAQGLACAAFAFWAQLTPYRYLGHISGAVLIDPVRPTRPRTFSFVTSPDVKLPFPSLLVSTSQDGHDIRQREFAARWGSELTTPGALATPVWPWLAGAVQLPLVAASEDAVR